MRHLLLLPLLAIAACVGPAPVPASIAPAAPVGAAVPAEPGPVAVVADKVVLEGARGLVLAHLAYQSVAALVLVPAEAGLIPAPLAARARDANRTALDALAKADAAADGAVRAREVARALDGIAALRGVATVMQER